MAVTLNKDKFKDYIFNIAITGESVAVNNLTGEPISCSKIKCSDCRFYENELCNYKVLLPKWCEEEVEITLSKALEILKTFSSKREETIGQKDAIIKSLEKCFPLIEKEVSK